MKNRQLIFLWIVITTQNIWFEVMKSLKITGDWNCSSIEENLKFWFLQFPKMRHIPFLVIWGIWKFRNKILFENWNRQDSMIVTKIILSIKDYTDIAEEDRFEYILNPIFFDDTPIGFFDGAVVDNVCGIGIYLKITPDHLVKAYFAGGNGNNMKAELLGLWGLLLLSSRLSIKKMMVVGDSKVTIDWINSKSNLNLLYLNSWKDKIGRLKDQFDSIKFMHVHRKFNKEADILSKKALKKNIGWLYYEELVKDLLSLQINSIFSKMNTIVVPFLIFLKSS
jgi:ribonuclease HI